MNNIELRYMLKKSFFLIKRKIFIFVAIIIILIIGGIFLFTNNNSKEENLIVYRSDFINTVSVSGKVVPVENVDLSFKNSGLIENIYFSVDQKNKLIKAGTLIAKIDADNAEKNVNDAGISLENARLSLEKLNLENSTENMNADLQKSYDDGFVAVSDAFMDFSPTIIGLDNILDNEENISDNVVRNSGTIALNYKNEAVKLYFKVKNEFEKNKINFRVLDRNSSKIDIENIINETYDTAKILIDAIKSAKNLADYLAEDTNRASDYLSYQNNLYDYANTINEHFSNLLSVKTNIKNYKDVFSSKDLDVKGLFLSIKQKENGLQDAKNKLEDYYIRAPFDGVITKVDAKVGEVASANTPMISMMSAGTFQIESYVPEVNIAMLKVGNEASVTLDAYGSEIFFSAKIISIDPAETMKDGVSTYKVILQFLEKDERVKSGMTANVSIITFNKPNTIVIPGGVIFEKDPSSGSGQAGKKFVQVKEDKKIIEKEIQTGSLSSLGRVEVISGLSEGDAVILNPKIK